MAYINKVGDDGGDDSGETGYIGYCNIDFAKINGYLFILITIISVIGNTLLIFLLVTLKDLNVVTKTFILNLACSDLIFTASLPFWAYYHLYHWVFGDFLCKFITGVYFVGLYSSIFILTALSVARFIAVVLNNWPNNSQREKCGVRSCVAAWLISIAVSVYDATKVKVEEDFCEDFSEVELGYYFQVSFVFFIPFLIIIVCHCSIIKKVFQATNRQRYKATGIIFCIVVVYIICWGPYNFLLFIKSLFQPNGCKSVGRLETSYNICRILAYSHCCMNPLLCLLSQKIRTHLLSLIKRVCLKSRDEVTEQSDFDIQLHLSRAPTSAGVLELNNN